jgi:putative tricarboxylic transport membrane protein
MLSAFSVAGMFLVSLGYSLVPLLLGFILGPLAEENLRRGMVIADGNLLTFVQRPVTAVLLLFILFILTVVLLSNRRRREIFAED